MFDIDGMYIFFWNILVGVVWSGFVSFRGFFRVYIVFLSGRSLFSIILTIVYRC